ncbi:hypothetical protein KI387_019421, partial [Taxus chinensis]
MSQGSPKNSGTVGPRVRKPAGSAEMRTFSQGRAGQKCANRPNRANRENLSQTIRKQMGHLACEYANRL